MCVTLPIGPVRLLKLLPVRERARHDEVEQRPQLFEGVLQRSAGDEQAVVGPELQQSAVEQGVVILQAVSLVHHKHRPVDGPQEVLVLQQDLVRGENGVKLEPLVGMTPLVLSDLPPETNQSK